MFARPAYSAPPESAVDAVDSSHPTGHLGAKVQCHLMDCECRLLATNGSQDHAAATSAYPPTADIRWPMSVIVPIPSALPLKADVAAVGRESPLLTHKRHWALVDLLERRP